MKNLRTKFNDPGRDTLLRATLACSSLMLASEHPLLITVAYGTLEPVREMVPSHLSYKETEMNFIDQRIEARKTPDKMKRWVLGFAFNDEQNRVLLVEKKRPVWQAGKWNGVGGEIERDETPHAAMNRESLEETGMRHAWSLVATITVNECDTLFVFRTIGLGPSVHFIQDSTDETLREWLVKSLPADLVAGVEWMIPFCLWAVGKLMMLKIKKLETI